MRRSGSEKMEQAGSQSLEGFEQGQRRSKRKLRGTYLETLHDKLMCPRY